MVSPLFNSCYLYRHSPFNKKRSSQVIGWNKKVDMLGLKHGLPMMLGPKCVPPWRALGFSKQWLQWVAHLLIQIIHCYTLSLAWEALRLSLLWLSLDSHWPALHSLPCFPRVGNTSSLIFFPSGLDPTSILTFGTIPLFPVSVLCRVPSPHVVPCCCEHNSFFKRQMVATLFSLNKKEKQLPRCKQESRAANPIYLECWPRLPSGKRGYLNKMSCSGRALPRPKYRALANNGDL